MKTIAILALALSVVVGISEIAVAYEIEVFDGAGGHLGYFQRWTECGGLETYLPIYGKFLPLDKTGYIQAFPKTVYFGGPNGTGPAFMNNKDLTLNITNSYFRWAGESIVTATPTGPPVSVSLPSSVSLPIMNIQSYTQTSISSSGIEDLSFINAPFTWEPGTYVVPVSITSQTGFASTYLNDIPGIGVGHIFQQLQWGGSTQ